MTDGLASSSPPPSLVLVVDDDKDTRAIIRQALLVLGHHVVEAEDGVQAQERCKEQLPEIIVLDLMMPRMTGLEFLKSFREQVTATYVPVLLLTALNDVDHKVEGLASGADDYLAKPFNYRELQARVQALLRIKALTNALYRRTHELEEANVRLGEMQEVLVQKERELVAAQMGGTAAHNLGQPLTTVLLHCRVLEKALKPLLASSSAAEKTAGEQAFGAAQAIQAECESMREIVSKLKSVDSRSVTDYVAGRKIIDIDK